MTDETNETLQPEAWTCSANEALHVSLAEPTRAVTFPPKFTYPIFGDAEQVYGYQGLRIDLAFDCLSMKPLLTHRYTAKLDNGTATPVDATLARFLPQEDTVVGSETVWADAVAAEAFALPPESLVRSYSRDGRTFDVYALDVAPADGLGRRLLTRVQVLALLYIEAGSYIDAADPGWTLYVVYERAPAKAVFVGFCTCYRYWVFSPETAAAAATVEDQPYRARLSQMVVLPPFQGAGHGSELYRTVAGADGVWVRDRRCVEITVEDPTDEFDVLRDRCDLERALAGGLLAQLAQAGPGPLPLGGSARRTLRRAWKLTPRQFDRVVEMALLARDGQDGKDADTVRLLVKRRVYVANREGLAALGDASLVRSKLEEVWRRVRTDHRRVAGAVAPGPLKRAREEDGEGDGDKPGNAATVA